MWLLQEHLLSANNIGAHGWSFMKGLHIIARNVFLYGEKMGLLLLEPFYCVLLSLVDYMKY